MEDSIVPIRNGERIMTSPVEEIIVHCPNCGFLYRDWMRPSINLSMDSFDDDYIDQATSSTCPECNFKVYHQSLIVNQAGVWEIEE